ncbi:helix-turn-helix domain-containing protein [Paralcaligenes ureilyticus]|uniref:Helix-turn-helix protein n=1 Tax=Paralcaligenes ureilyticus TaxID=627131 RepID=A0A4R3LMA2_9BURK|nr:helix-turn-helix domain-containing protein [Paralcaligenes ureilyticus]TCT01483.1 helix-turn-helix protein [Paralcaligenes ureilyticus]
MKKFSERLQYARNLRGLTQAQLAQASRLSQGAIANYESGTRHESKGIFRLAEALQVNVLWLSQGVGAIESAATPAPPPSGNQLADSARAQPAASWPFQTISRESYQSLSSKDRAVIESTVAALIVSLSNK